MKPENLKWHPAGDSPRGYALVVVLSAVVLCALMVILLLERGSLGIKSASAYSHTAQVRSLSEMAVNRVLAQIRDATTVNQTASTPLDERDTWASQPGALRVFQVGGDLRKIYKLYSSDVMQTSSPVLSTDVPADWFSRPDKYTDLNEPVRSGTHQFYPIVHPDAADLLPDAKGVTDGFSITSAPLNTDVPAPNPAPMPVRWIYVLRDGTHCQLGDGRIDRTANPIIGRIAFWTDDETTKVNINTASPVTADSHWDIPRARGNETTAFKTEHDFGWKQPSQNEYQRYPGHPATVSLRPVLGNLSGILKPDYFGLTPYYRWGGSEDGTKRIDAARTSLLINKEDRRYATVDEFLFDSKPTVLRSRPLPAQMDGLRFFLTASSRAPELNLFGQPRVTIWPVHREDSDVRRTPYDRLIAFCSTIGGKPYFFTREDPRSPSHDYDEIARNQELYSYLKALTEVSVPGFDSGSFATKYASDHKQILTEIFDYIRTTNLNETYEGRDSGFLSYTPNLEAAKKDGQYGPDKPTRGAGFVVPIEIGDTKGGGRFPAITGAGLWFIQHLPAGDLDLTKPQLQAMLVIKTTTPSHGYMPWVGPDLQFEIKNATVGAQVGGTSATLFPGGLSKKIFYPTHFNDYEGFTPGGYDGAAWTSGGGTSDRVTPPHPFFSVDIPVEAAASTFSILAGSVDVEMIVDGKTLQTYQFEFPGVNNLPLPVIDPREITPGRRDALKWWANRTAPIYAPLNDDVLRSVELSHGDARLALMTVTSGTAHFTDYVPHTNYSDPSKRFAHSMRTHVSSPILWPEGTTGSYVKDAPLKNQALAATSYGGRNVTSNYHPDIPSTITDLREKGWSGDFDNGVGDFPDGPFLNKPDEGTKSYAADEPPYMRSRWVRSEGFFSPLRQVPSPVMFGSLPTGVKAKTPWRTLLFCANPRDPGHKGFDAPADSLLLDLFRMPVVEPYAISGPLSTDGKINMNYAIAPFSYIRRATPLYGILEALKFFAVPDAESGRYKGVVNNVNFRREIEVEETLSQFETRFASNDLFRSATEICTLFLVPKNGTLADAKNLTGGFWSTHRLTGDNSREKPYAELYPKLTTQSNSYRIHMRVQVLPPSEKLPDGRTDFTPLAEYRGSRLIERYLALDNPRFSEVDPDKDCLNDLYQYRVLESSQFNP